MRLQIRCEDRQGLGHEVLAILLQYDINLSGIELAADGLLYLSFPDLAFTRFQQLMPQLRRLPSVLDVRAVSFLPSEWRSQELLALLAALPDPVLSVDRQGRVLLVNQAAETLLQVPAEQLEGSGVDQWLTGFGFARQLTELSRGARSGWVQVAGQRLLVDLMPVSIGQPGSAGPGTSQPADLAGALIRVRLRGAAGAGDESRAGDREQETQSDSHRSSQQPFDALTGSSAAFVSLKQQAERAALLEQPVLFEGETGSGKELLARACHQASLRRKGPFVVINCASLPDEVAEQELFGYLSANGSEQPGLLDQADGGTLLLDEVGEMSATLQSKLLRFLQQGCFRRIGAGRESFSDVRILATTRHDLIQRCQQGLLRQELYYLLAAIRLQVPPLRERQEDVLALARHFLLRLCAQQNTPLPAITAHCQQKMREYAWPGNVRQLENALLQAVSLSRPEQAISWQMLALPAYDGGFGYVAPDFDGTLEQAVKQFEADLLRRLYPAYPSTRRLAAKLGISHTAVANKLREYGIS